MVHLFLKKSCMLMSVNTFPRHRCRELSAMCMLAWNYIATINRTHSKINSFVFHKVFIAKACNISAFEHFCAR